MVRRVFQFVMLHLVAAVLPLAALQAEAWRSSLDLRDLPAMTRPAVAVVEVDTSAAAARDLRPLLTFAINGWVIRREEADPSGKTVLRVPLQDRLISTENTIEVAAILPNCATTVCATALASARPLRPVRFELARPQAEIDDFSQLATTFRAGIAGRAETPREQRLLAMARAALAPRGKLDAAAKAAIYVGPNPPPGATPLLRFDKGPVRLERSDGAVIFSQKEMDAMTAVQVVRGRDRPILWIRPGTGPLPDELYLSDGDIGLFDGAGRAIAWSRLRDNRAIRINYLAGHDPYAADQTMLTWRIGLAIFWILATLGLIWIYRRIAAPARSEAAQ